MGDSQRALPGAVTGRAAANLSALGAAVLYGASVVAVRVAVRDIPPLSLAVLRFGLGTLLLAGALLILAPARLRVRRASVGGMALLGLIFFALFPLAFNTGLQFTEASRAGLMLATMPIWSLWLARKVAGERLTGRQTAGVGLTFLGVAIVLAERGLLLRAGSRALLGDALLLVTALLGAIYGVLAQRSLREYAAVTVTTYAMACGTMLLLPGALWEGLAASFARLDEPRPIALVAFLGILGGAVAFYLWTSALSGLTPTQVSVYVNLNPVVATFLGATLLGEELSVLFVAGFVAVVAGVGIVNRPARPVLVHARRKLSR
jgi:drug/metabolite transporter (DMT)-like permease